MRKRRKDVGRGWDEKRWVGRKGKRNEKEEQRNAWWVEV